MGIEKTQFLKKRASVTQTLRYFAQVGQIFESVFGQVLETFLNFNLGRVERGKFFNQLLTPV